jgi:methionine-rich copper-binding protein CopC
MMMLHIRLLRWPAVALSASMLLTLLPGIAQAHSELVSSVPAQGAIVPSPFTGPIVLTFSEHLADGSKADLVGPGGTTIAAASVDATAMTMTFTLPSALDPGAYEVRWVSIADDGDVLRQPIVKFTVAAAPSASPPPSASPTAGPTTSAAPSASAVASATSTSTSAPSVGATAAASAGGDTSGSTGDVVLPIVVALIVLVAGAAYLLSRRNRPPDAT